MGLGTASGGLIEVPVMRVSPRLQSRFGPADGLRDGVRDLRDGLPAVGPDRRTPPWCRCSRSSRGWRSACCSRAAWWWWAGCCLRRLYSTGNSVAQMVGFGLGPILGAGLGGLRLPARGAGRAVRGGVRAGAGRRRRRVVRATRARTGPGSSPERRTRLRTPSSRRRSRWDERPRERRRPDVVARRSAGVGPSRARSSRSGTAGRATFSRTGPTAPGSCRSHARRIPRRTLRRQIAMCCPN